MHSVLNALVGSPIIATDGETGSIRNFLFDDQSWKIRYLVVDVGSWLKRQDVVIPVTALERPDWVNKTFRAHLTKKQLGDSPNVDTEKPVSRRQEIAMAEYFGPVAVTHQATIVEQAVEGAVHKLSRLIESTLRRLHDQANRRTDPPLPEPIDTDPS